MGGLCSKSSHAAVNAPSAANPWAGDNRRQVVDDYKLRNSKRTATSAATEVAPPPAVDINSTQQQQQPARYSHDGPALVYEGGADTTDDFYDGIPRYKSSSFRSKAKVSEVGSRIGRGAVSVLDTLGSSMTNLNSGAGFNSAPPAKGNEIAIIAFEIANTVVKGYNLMQSVSTRSIKNLKEVVFPSEGVQYLVSIDTDELMRIVAADKREELKIFSGEVVRFGNQCKDPQWHNLDRYFEKISRELIPQKHLKEEASSVIQQLMTLVQYTAELYHEFHALDRFEQDYERKRFEESISSSTDRGDTLGILRSELKSQRKLVKSLKKKSLWSKSMEEVMEKLVEIVHFLYLEIHAAFGSAEGQKTVEGATNKHQKLGPAGLSLHYANIVLQIDTLVVRSSAPPPTTRDTLYQSLPPNIKSSLRSKLHSFHIKEELTITEIKAEMEKTLHWLVPMAANTAKDHHGFGWVGEWASTGSETNRKPAPQTEVIRIETFHHANREKTEACVLKLVLWLHYLVSQSKPASTSVGMRSPVKSIATKTLPKTNEQLKDIRPSTMLTTDDQEMLQDVSKRRRVPGISKSQDYDNANSSLGNRSRLNKSNSYTSGEETKKLLPFSRLSSGVPVIDFGIDKEKALDVIDRVDTQRDHHHPRE
ncbi:protein PSK SIMULATOR 1-like [Rosa sericea]